MASITGLSAAVSTSKDKIFLTKAILTCSCSYTSINSNNIDSDPSKPKNAPTNETDTATTYDGEDYGAITSSYRWTFNGNSASSINNDDYTISGLTQKSKNSIICKLTVSATQIYRSVSQKWKAKLVQTRGAVGEYEWIKDGDPVYGIKQNISLVFSSGENEKTVNIDVYTRPGLFLDYNFTADTIIESQEGLTAQKVSNWIDHCNAYNHWYNQTDTDAIDEESICHVNTNDIITAAWYNACVDAIQTAGGTPPLKVIGGASGTIITASVINALGTAISKDDS